MQQFHWGKGKEETMGTKKKNNKPEVENRVLPGQAAGYITLLQDKGRGAKGRLG